VMFISKKFSGAECNYAVIEKEWIWDIENLNSWRIKLHLSNRWLLVFILYNHCKGAWSEFTVNSTFQVNP
jgi:hypothetical protein